MEKLNKQQEKFCKEHNITKEQFLGKEEIGGDLYLSGLTEIQKAIDRLEELGFERSWDCGNFPFSYIIIGIEYFYLRSSIPFGNTLLTLEELFKEDFEKGKVYKCEKGSLVYCTEDCDQLYGYGFLHMGDWASSGFGEWKGNYKEAPISEWKEALKKEAKRRGFKEGFEFYWKHPMPDYSLTFSYDCGPERYEYDPTGDELCFYGGVVYQQGVWAEIIKKGIEINGYEGKDMNTYWEFGENCAKINKKQIKGLLEGIQKFNTNQWFEHNREIKSITLDSGVEITVEQLEHLKINQIKPWKN